MLSLRNRSQKQTKMRAAKRVGWVPEGDAEWSVVSLC